MFLLSNGEVPEPSYVPRLCLLSLRSDSWADFAYGNDEYFRLSSMAYIRVLVERVLKRQLKPGAGQ